MNKHSTTPGSVNPPPTFIVLSLIGIALAVAIIGVLKACECFAHARAIDDSSLAMDTALSGAAWFIFGLAAAGLLWAVATLLMQNYRLMENNRFATSMLAWAERNPLPSTLNDTTTTEIPPAKPQPTAAPVYSGGEAPPPPPAVTEPNIFREIRDQLAEMNANLLLTDEQIQVKRNRHQLERADKLVIQIEQSLDIRQFVEAERLLARLCSEVPDDPRCEQLRGRIEQARRQAQEEEIKLAIRRVEDLMAVASFDKATAAAEELVLRFPASHDATELLERVRREAVAFSTEQRKRLCTEIERHVEGRRWRQAVTASQRLLQAYPDSGEAQLVNAQLPTMQANARLEDVRELRDRILDLIERRRFAEAASMARDLIRQYHDTAAAEEFAKRLPKLDELARGPQRVGAK